MTYKILVLLGVLLLWNASVYATTNPISVALTKSESQQWSVSFTAVMWSSKIDQPG